MKIGLLLIATGKYEKFIKPLIESANKYFLKKHEVTYFLFTDSNNFNNEKNIIKIKKEHMPWPSPSLTRYETFVQNESIFEQMDYLFYCDIDMLFVDEIDDDILSERVATIHPGFLGNRGTPETNPESKAFIGVDEKLCYYAGGFNGGSKIEFLKMSKILDLNIKDDLKKGIIAVWFDESHTNRYFLDNPPTKILSPSYCYPESWDLPFKKKILALDKNHKEMRK